MGFRARVVKAKAGIFSVWKLFVVLTAFGVSCKSQSTSALLASIANTTTANAAENQPWVQSNVSLMQSKSAVQWALSKAGGTGALCTASVPLLAIPGFQLISLPGVIYPSGFAVAVQTANSATSAANSQNAAIVSPVASFSNVAPSYVNVTVYVIASSTPYPPTAPGCSAGTEWRYLQLGASLTTACNCPANSQCSGPTYCPIAPAAGAQWAVAAVPTSLCAAQASSGPSALALGLGIGLGLGLPFLCAVAACGYFCGRKPPPPPLPPSKPAPPSTAVRALFACMRGSSCLWCACANVALALTREGWKGLARAGEREQVMEIKREGEGEGGRLRSVGEGGFEGARGRGRGSERERERGRARRWGGGQ